ncbi:MAG: Lrp/AsnC family transcriptional regulator, regulator for asnA, asnC and gidA [Thermoproteota archaeon]|nr:Lrp/AsnC family transcriptional regulator, regulator for asnA, asnC and gidA [Thermoproteota archaeon]
MSEKKPKIDKIDKAIIRLLMKNGRMRDIEIAKVIDVSDDTIRRRRQRLEEGDYFRIEAVFNARKFGYTNFYQIGLVLAPGVDTRSVAEKLTKLDPINFVALSLGPTHSILANCRSKDPLELNRLVEELRAWKEIERVDVNIVYDVVKAMSHRLPGDALK